MLSDKNSRMSARRPKPGTMAFLLVVLLVLLVWVALKYAPRRSDVVDVPQPETGSHVVVNVVDGDTIDLDNGERLRLIGVDAPETRSRSREKETCGPEATAFVRQLALGQRVRLAYDWERYDRNHRTLAYVILEDGTFLNAEIIRRGFAHAYRKFRYRYKDDFLRYERRAHEERVGCLPVRAPHMERE